VVDFKSQSLDPTWSLVEMNAFWCLANACLMRILLSIESIDPSVYTYARLLQNVQKEKLCWTLGIYGRVNTRKNHLQLIWVIVIHIYKMKHEDCGILSHAPIFRSSSSVFPCQEASFFFFLFFFFFTNDFVLSSCITSLTTVNCRAIGTLPYLFCNTTLSQGLI
jgi:hypothetical protein